MERVLRPAYDPFWIDGERVMTAALAAPLEADARRARAMRDLGELRMLAAAVAMEADGGSQRDIAERLGIPQATLNRALRKVRLMPWTFHAADGPKAIILEAIVYDLPREEMIAKVVASGPTVFFEDPESDWDEDGYPGSWSQVEDAFRDEYLTEAEFNTLAVRLRIQ